MTNTAETLAMKYYSSKTVEKITRCIKNSVEIRPKVGIIFSSQFESLREVIEDRKEIQYSQIKKLPKKLRSQYNGKLTFGRIESTEVVSLYSRDYECHPGYLKRMFLEVMVKMGVKNVILVNTAHGLHSTFKEGDIMIVRDHIDMVVKTSLVDALPYSSSQISAASVYNRTYISQARSLLISTTATTHDGVIASVSKNSYETTAEAKMLQMVGADAIGSSSAFEANLLSYHKTKIFSFVLLTRCYDSFCKWTDEYESERSEVIVESRKSELQLMVKSVAQIMDVST